MGSKENLRSPQSPTASEFGSRKSSFAADTATNRRTSVHESGEHHQSTSEMFKDMLSQKRNMLMSKLTSFESDVSTIVHSIGSFEANNLVVNCGVLNFLLSIAVDVFMLLVIFCLFDETIGQFFCIYFVRNLHYCYLANF